MDGAIEGQLRFYERTSEFRVVGSKWRQVRR